MIRETININSIHPKCTSIEVHNLSFRLILALYEVVLGNKKDVCILV